MNAKFMLGRLVATRGVAELMNTDQRFASFVSDSLKRYITCDWGDLCKDDRTMNDEAVLASYDHPTHEDWKIWIITEWDRSVTTILFPSEY